jgi:Putative beta-barrel porin 2
MPTPNRITFAPLALALASLATVIGAPVSGSAKLGPVKKLNGRAPVIEGAAEPLDGTTSEEKPLTPVLPLSQRNPLKPKSNSTTTLPTTEEPPVSAEPLGGEEPESTPDQTTTEEATTSTEKTGSEATTATKIENSPLEATLFPPLPNEYAAGSDFAPRQAATAKRMTVSIEGGMTYDSNVFLGATKAGQATDDFLYTLGARANFTLGDAVSKAESYLSLSYQPQVVVFQNNPSENALDHDVHFMGQKRWARTALGADLRFQQISGSTVELSDRVGRQVASGKIMAAYGWTEKLKIDTSLHYTSTQFQEAGFNDSEEISHETFVEYLATVKTRLAAGFGWGQLNVDGPLGGSQDFQRALIRLTTDVGGKLSFNARGGMEFRQFESGGSQTPIFGIGIEWKPKEGTSFRLDATRSVEASGSASGSNVTRTGLVIGARQRLGSRFTLGLDAGWDTYSYSVATAGLAAQAAQGNDSFFIRPSLSYQLRDDWRAELWFAFRTVDSSSAGGDYDVQQAGINFRFDF